MPQNQGNLDKDFNQVIQLINAFDLALEYYEQNLTLRKSLGHKLGMAKSLNLISRTHLNKGNLDLAIAHFEQSLALIEDFDYKHNLDLFLVTIAYLYRRKGKLDLAYEYAKQSLSLSDKMVEKGATAWSLAMISYIHHQKGELDLALKYAKQSLDLFGNLGHKGAIAYALDSIGSVYRQKGELDLALKQHQQSLTLREEVGDNFDTALTLFNLISTSIDTNSLDQARQYLQSLKELNETQEDLIINQRWRVADALILKTSTRARNRGKAEELLLQVVEEKVVDHELMVISLLNLCDLLLAELRLSDDSIVLQEVQSYVTQLQEIATQQGSPWLLAETYLLQSKLALVELDLARAREYLNKAQIIAEERDLFSLAIKISTDHDTLLEQLSEWEDLIERDSTMDERFELAHLEDLMMLMIQKRTAAISEFIEEQPELLLIIESKSGRSVYSKPFRTDQPINERLIGGFLTAINSFLREAFAVSGSIERIKHRQYTLLLNLIDPFLVCYVFQGPSYFALKRLKQFTDAISTSEDVLRNLQNALHDEKVITTGTLDDFANKYFQQHND